MIAIVCEWGGDLSIGPSGDVNVTSIETDIQQRIVRRLFTNRGDYIWNTGYGAGLGGFVGEPRSSEFIESTILNQLQLERLVAVTPTPIVKTSRPSTGLFSTTSVTIQYQAAGAFSVNSVVLELGIP